MQFPDDILIGMTFLATASLVLNLLVSIESIFKACGRCQLTVAPQPVPFSFVEMISGITAQQLECNAPPLKTISWDGGEKLKSTSKRSYGSIAHYSIN